MYEMLSPVFENFHFNPRGTVELMKCCLHSSSYSAQRKVVDRMIEGNIFLSSLMPYQMLLLRRPHSPLALRGRLPEQLQEGIQFWQASVS